MTEGNLSEQILFFSIPLMISNLLQALFNMADIAVVGQFSGPIALERWVPPLYLSGFLPILIGMGSGVNTICARHIGAKDYSALKDCLVGEYSLPGCGSGFNDMRLASHGLSA